MTDTRLTPEEIEDLRAEARRDSEWAKAQLRAQAVSTVDDPATVKIIDEQRTELMRVMNESIKEMEGKPPSLGDKLRGATKKAVAAAP